MKNYYIVSGGTFHRDIFLDFLHKEVEKPFIVAADKGLEYLYDVSIKPDVVVGDFDSLSSFVLDKIEKDNKDNKISIIRLNTEKDYTDTEKALDIIIDKIKNNKKKDIEKNSKKDIKPKIYLFAGTGKRIDHVYANIGLLLKAKENKADFFIVDDKIRIRLLNKDDDFVIKKEEEYGNYISIFALTEVVKGLNLKGFKYNLKDFNLSIGKTLGESNEIKDDKAFISMKEGLLLVIESMD